MNKLSDSKTPRLEDICRLALYVYEYLLHVGAQKSAQTFLSECPPCLEGTPVLAERLRAPTLVFWDLYCAAPDRRETCEHSSEAKAFHDYPLFWMGQTLSQMSEIARF
eukprot:superscaffoldBa00000412_g4531